MYVKAVVAAFNQEKALVGAFSVIVKTDCETDGSSAALAASYHITPVYQIQVLKLGNIIHLAARQFLTLLTSNQEDRLNY